MSFTKFATAQFLEQAEDFDTVKSQTGSSEGSKIAIAQFKTKVAKFKKSLALSHDFMYIRTRAIGSLENWGPNQNGDGFPMKELRASYQSFIGKGNFLDHKSDDLNAIRGLVVDAFLNEDDGCVECLIAVDKKSHPQLARDIETGMVNSVSMGTRVGWSECSVCGNIARTDREYCDHIAGYKGMKMSMYTNNSEHKFGAWPIHEVNHDLEFIELSWVGVPAFREANVLEKIASLKKAVDGDRKTKLADSLIPENLLKMHEDAQCKGTECATDIRANRKNDNVKVVSSMLRIKIDIKQLTYRKTWKDYKANGSVTLNEKDYEWTAYSQDKQAWHLNLEDSAADQISAGGIKSIENAVAELLNKNVDTTELIVSSDKGKTTTAYLNNQVFDPNMTGYINDRFEEGKKNKEMIYPNEKLEIQGTDGKTSRDLEEEAYKKSAKEGPAGPLGKRLKEKDETLNSKELKFKEELSRAATKYYLQKEA
jgi:hypothetical protein